MQKYFPGPFTDVSKEKTRPIFDTSGQKKVFNKTTISQQYPGKKQFNLEDYPEVPAQVRVILWLGLEKHQEAWTNRQDIEGDFCVFAETVRLN